MEFSIKSGSPEKQRSACVVVGVFESRRLTLAAELLDKAAGGYIGDIVRRGDMEGKSGTTLLLHKVPGTLCDRVLLVGLGKEKDFREKEFTQAIRAAIKALHETGALDASIFLTELAVKKHDIAWRIRQTVIAARDATYRFEQFKSKKDENRRSLRRLTLGVERRNELAQAEEALIQGQAIAAGMALAKDLGNLPANVCNPAYLASRAQALADELGLECEILERADMEKLGMNALLSVANGARQPPKLIVLGYRGARINDKPLVLIGKGITFDSGGISLKPGADMDEMKYDMCGAASVLGALAAAARMKLSLNLKAIIPASENMPGGNASRPGDIVTSLSGQTIEILNTDAEGRLLLCDALSYAERFDPDTVIDVATLTGACAVALGGVASGLFANRDNLARDLIAAGDEAHDRVWHLPLWDDYQELLKSPFADMANVGGRWAGAVTAACFLSRFAKKFDWAHLDIAGTAWKSGKDKGATGRPVALLAHYLLQRAGKLN
ncbi:MAG: leucyl aminopeptidase [Betaproteobacteria bacterium]|nr:leucyl aminopeptidase [Betaproteobacteria bacterium]MCL2885797.1 leucyl aminopeptidase [Betaproteobacteria bacterium]